MEEETITFEYIRTVQRAEQRNADLTKIPEDFYSKVRSYLEQKKKILKKKKDKSMSIELKNVERILEDIYNRRETKIVTQAILSLRTGLVPQNLIEDEKKLFDSVFNVLKKHRKEILNKVFEEKEDRKELKSEFIEFLEDVPEFVGIDLKKYGPYNKGDKALIPKDNAELFINAGKAKKLEEENK